MKRSRSLMMSAVVLAPLLALGACARDGGPAPVEYRGVGAGETSPGMANASARTQRYAAAAANTIPPPSYQSSAQVTGSSIQRETLAEPNDAYAQQATAPRPAATASAQPATSDGQSLGQQSLSPQPFASQAASASAVEARPSAAPATQPVQPLSGQAGQPVTSIDRDTGNGGAPAVQPTATNAPRASAQLIGEGSYGWPLRGRLISGFGPKTGGQANDGYNIAAPLGTSVYASKDGTVAYAGNELRGFGNMVLVRHSGGMFTVYAHLDQINVRKDQSVTKGQPVGTVGQSGGVSEPQLHFEVRRGSTPLDPGKYLGQ